MNINERGSNGKVKLIFQYNALPMFLHIKANIDSRHNR